MSGIFDSNATDSNDNTQVSLADTAQLDAFQRLRISVPQTIFDCTFLFDKQPLLFSESAVSGGTATHNANSASVDLAVTTTTNSEIIFQSRRYLKYHPGKSQIILMTGNLNGGATNVRKRIGYFDANNGLFFELNGSTLNVVRRTKTSGSVVDVAVAQSSWNLDRLDGTGAPNNPSGLTLDLTKQQIFVIDFQWLGSGRIRYGFFIGGKLIYVHQEINANTLTLPWSQTGNLPIRLEVKNSGSTASSMHFTCCTAISENFWGPEGILRTANNGSTPRNLGSAGSILPILSLRKQTAFVTVPIQIIDFGLSVGSADDFLVRVITNGTLTGASFSNIDGVCQQDSSATAITGGTTVHSFYVLGSSGTTGFRSIDVFRDGLNTFLGSDLAGVSDIISIVATSITNSSSTFAHINYKELL